MMNRLKCCSGSTLKLIAIITMFIDHLAFVLLTELLLAPEYAMEAAAYDTWMNIYGMMRHIGRSSFPIFCFLLAEGFFYTRSRKRYAMRLGIFALLSEAVFDAAFFNGMPWEHQNVFFTLFIGFLTIWAMEVLKEQIDKWVGRSKRRSVSHAGLLTALVQLLICAAGCIAAYLFKTDYKYMGVLLIVIFYFFRSMPMIAAGAGYTMLACLNAAEAASWPGFIGILMYNHEKGRTWNKYVFYAFYPVHLLLLVLVREYIMPLFL